MCDNESDFVDSCNIFKWNDIARPRDDSYFEWSFSRLCGLELPSESDEKLLGSGDIEFMKPSRVEHTCQKVQHCQSFNNVLSEVSVETNPPMSSNSVRVPNFSDEASVIASNHVSKKLTTDQLQSKHINESDNR